jgi:NAD(P)-dependent dehydrogenase (short-subunit alcohol dehydrogenase family)
MNLKLLKDEFDYLKSPGATATSMLKKLATPRTDHFAETIVKMTPLQRFGIPDDMAKAIVFLASSDAQFITGVNLIVDGGIRYNLPADIMGSN